MKTKQNRSHESGSLARRVLGPLSLALLAGSAQAAVLIQDDFESNTNGTAPTGWTLNASPTTFLVSTAYQSPIGQVGDNKGMHLDNDPDVTFEDMNRSFTAQTGTFYLQFDYYAEDKNELHNVQIGDGGFATPGRGPNITMSTATGVVVDTWYRFTATINVATDTYDVRLQSLESTTVDTTTTNIAFNNAQTKLDRIKFWFNTGNEVGNGEYAIDNVLVTDNSADLNFAVIPEPSSFTMGLLGLLGLWKRQRRG